MEDEVKQLFQSYYNLTRTCASEVAKRCEGSNREAILKELDTALCGVAELDCTVREESKIFNSIENEISQATEKEWGDLSQMVEQRLAKNGPIDINKFRDVIEYRSHVEGLADNSELEEMIVMSSENKIDPYSKKPIEVPVRPRHCNHVFDKASVLEVLAASKKKKLRCPYVGCQKWFTEAELVDANKDGGSDEDD